MNTGSLTAIPLVVVSVARSDVFPLATEIIGTVTWELVPAGIMIVWFGVGMLTIPETALTLATTVMSVVEVFVIVNGSSAELARTVKSLPSENETNSSKVLAVRV
jgi:hypothetical protein